MAEVHGVAGEWARVNGTVRGMQPLFGGCFLAGFAIALMFCHFIIGSVLLMAAAAVCVWSYRRGVVCVERFFKGARGEEKVAAILRSLPAPYHIFNDFVACGRHIDHVVVGPAGVYAVETKFWRGRVTIEDGDILLDGSLPDRSPLAQVLGEAKLVKEQLVKSGWKGDVTPVLVFASDTFNAQPAELHGAVIMNSNALKASFDTGAVVLPPPELERLVRLMENNQ